MTRVGAQIPRWGPHAEADGLLALWQRHDAGEIDYVAEDHGLVVAMAPIERRQTRLAGRNGPMHLAPAGSVNIIPAGADHWGWWGAPKESVYLAVSPRRLVEAAAGHFARDQVELFASNRLVVDPVLLHFATLLRDELRRGGLLTELYTDALGTLIMVHLLRRHSAIGQADPVGRPRRGGLTPQARRAVVEHMTECCGEPLSLAHLATLAGLAPSSFLRAFREELGITPHRHLLRLRVRKAELMLRTSDLPVAQVALASGFSSQSHLTTIFRALTGSTPAAYRRDGPGQEVPGARR